MLQCQGKGEEFETCFTFWDIAACLVVATAHVPGPEVRSKRLQRQAGRRSRRKSRAASYQWVGLGYEPASSFPLVLGFHACLDATRYAHPQCGVCRFHNPKRGRLSNPYSVVHNRRFEAFATAAAPQDDWCNLCVVNMGCALLR